MKAVFDPTPPARSIDPWDLFVDSVATRVLAAVPLVRDVALRKRLRTLAIDAMMAASPGKRDRATRKLGETLFEASAEEELDPGIAYALSEPREPVEETVWVH